jgi:hypothetical protein
MKLIPHKYSRGSIKKAACCLKFIWVGKNLIGHKGQKQEKKEKKKSKMK